MKKAIILINAYTTAKNELNQPKRLCEELEKLGVKTEIKRNFLSAEMERGKAENYLGQVDFCIYLDKDRYAGALLERAGLRLFNRPESVAVCDDKMQTFLALEGFPLPETIAAPLCYSPQAEVDEVFLRGVAEKLGFPLVVKECYGSLGKGVYLAHDFEELRTVAGRLKCKPHLFQKFVAESAGRDIRVIVVGGKAFSAMLRTSNGDFRSNLELGGKGEEYPLDDEAISLCEKIAARLGLDYCGIDLLLGNGGYLICEVNSNAFFGGMERLTGKNVARAYAEHILKEIYGGIA